MAFEGKDNIINDELWNVEPATAVSKGDAAVVQDVFGFYAKDRESAGEEVTFYYRMRQVEAAKKTGTGEAITAGDRLYYIVADDAVTPNKPASGFGTTYYFCGWAKKDAAAIVSVVIMNFDGTRYDEDI